jgi:hypothetical protein
MDRNNHFFRNRDQIVTPAFWAVFRVSKPRAGLPKWAAWLEVWE